MYVVTLNKRALSTVTCQQLLTRQRFNSLISSLTQGLRKRAIETTTPIIGRESMSQNTRYLYVLTVFSHVSERKRQREGR